ncbi:MAG: hypothetical protein RIS43_170, partial [Actinomycetota bacterium]
MKKRTKRLLAAGVVAVFLAFSWTHSATFIGIAPPGYCAIKSSDGILQLSNSDANDFAKRQWNDKSSLAKESVSCTYWPTGGFGKQDLDKIGLTPRAHEVLDATKKAFGFIPYGGFAPGGVTSGHKPGSAHYEGRAIDFFFKPYTDKAKKLSGWQLAQWAVLNAERLHIATVIYDDRVWTYNGSYQGWHQFVPEYGDPQ